MKNTYYSRMLSGRPECCNCVCMYCNSTECPYIDYSQRASQWERRCYQCNYRWFKIKPIRDHCDFFHSSQIPRPKVYTIVRRYRKKSELQIISERLEKIEQILDKLKEK